MRFPAASIRSSSGVSSALCCFNSSLLLKMTVSGVLRSWEASATNCRCMSQAWAMGFTAQPDRSHTRSSSASQVPAANRPRAFAAAVTSRSSMAVSTTAT